MECHEAAYATLSKYCGTISCAAIGSTETSLFTYGMLFVERNSFNMRQYGQVGVV